MSIRPERRPPLASLPVDLRLPLHGHLPADPRQGAHHRWSTVPVDWILMQGRVFIRDYYGDHDDGRCVGGRGVRNGDDGAMQRRTLRREWIEDL